MTTFKLLSPVLPCQGHAFRHLRLLSLLLGRAATTAQVYFTRSGTIRACGTFRREAVVAPSHRQPVRIHYNTSEIHLPTSSPPRMNSILAVFNRWAVKGVWLTGTFKTWPLPTGPRPKQAVPILGTHLLNGRAKTYSQYATLMHLSEGRIRCVLPGELITNLNHLGVLSAPSENRVQLGFRPLALSSPKNNNSLTA